MIVRERMRQDKYIRAYIDSSYKKLAKSALSSMFLTLVCASMNICLLPAYYVMGEPLYFTFSLILSLCLLRLAFLDAKEYEDYHNEYRE